MVGSAYDALREGFFGEHKDRLLLIDYEALATEPQRAIDHIYDFIGEPAFEHDFRRVEDDDVGAREFDISLGAPDLHDIRPRVELIERESILPPDIFERFQHDAFWQMHPWRRAANVVLPRD
jgi:sulfotransferase